MTQRALSSTPPRIRHVAGQGNSGSVDRTFGAVGAGAAGALGLVLVGVAVAVARIAWPSVRATGFSFVTDSVWDPSRGSFGALAFVWGTLLTSLIALSLAVPIGLGVAVFLTEDGKMRFRQFRARISDHRGAHVPGHFLILLANAVSAACLKSVADGFFADRFYR